MIAYQHLQTRREGAVEYVTLNRPDVRNAFNETVIAELTQWAGAVSADKAVRVAVLAGAGTVFCAGADLAWMSKMAAYTRDENVRDAETAAAMYGALDSLPMPLIGRIQGAALGGGAGLAAVCDMVVADEQAVFGFTEVKLGILPSMIAPFVLQKIGLSAARELFLSGRRFDAAQAQAIGLVHAVVSQASLDEKVREYVTEILSAGPEAVATAKALLRTINGRAPHDVRALTAETIADRRVSAEGQEGMAAFLAKRRASWNSAP